MVNEDILNWLKNGLEKGYSLKDLEQQMLKKGFSKKDVNEALDKMGKRKFSIKTVAVVFITLIILGAFVYFAAELLSKAEINNCLKKYPSANAQNCKDIMVFEDAKSQLDMEYCNKIQDKLINEECSKTISDIILQKKVQQSTNDVGAYINAITGKNPELCGSIVDESLKSRCLNESK